MVKVLAGVVVCAGFVAVCALAGGGRGTAKEKRAKALELLNRYADTQDKLQSSYIIKTEHINVLNAQSGHFDIHDLKAKMFTDIRTDGDRCCARCYQWGDQPRGKPLSRAKAGYLSSLWDGKYSSSYTRGGRSRRNDLGRLIFRSEGADDFKGILITRSRVCQQLGFFFGDEERVDLVLRTSENISVRDKKEKAGASDCYVIDAVVKNRGRYTLWIDPEHGYNIARARVIKGENDEIYGKIPKGIKFNAVASIDNVRFEKINDLWVPAEADIEIDQKWDKGQFEHDKMHSKLVEMILDPDHDALGSFDRGNDVKDGAVVRFYDRPGTYRWLRGARYVVDNKGRVVSYDPNEGLLPVVKTLPPLKKFKMKINPRRIKDKMVVMCFIDIKQRASQDCVTELKGLAESLAEKEVVVVLVQASEIEAEELDRWKRKNKIRFALGRLYEKRIKELLGAWGVERLPWLILTDKEHIVTAEGFSLKELDDKIKESEDF
ncbi:MAG: thioredoxin domain-containing protein [Planctomycetota bacterium]|jgi:hypothetical protein